MPRAGSSDSSTSALDWRGRAGAAGRAILLVLAAAIGTAILLHVGSQLRHSEALEGPAAEGGWTGRSRAWFIPTGLHPPEIGTADHPFSWTEETFAFSIPNLHRRQPHQLLLELSAGRPSGEPVDLLVSVDGVLAATEQIDNARRRVEIAIPPRRGGGVAVSVRVSSIFVPGPEDPRKLGVVVHSIGLAAPDSVRPSPTVSAYTGLAAALIVAGILLCGMPSWRLEWLSVLATPLAVAWLMLTDGAFLGVFVDRFVTIGAGAFAIGVVVGLLRLRWPVVLGLPEWSAACGLLLGATAIKFAFVAHPMAVVGDGIFQVHRAMLVERGQYLFTSITPSPSYEIPYPVGLYVTTLPFWKARAPKLDQVRVLRNVTLVADALVGLALYAVARRQWGNPHAALLVAGLWAFARAPAWGICNANLTNVFGQALFGSALGVLAWAGAGPRIAVAGMVTGGALLVAAYLSHFGTVLIGVPLVALIGGVLLVAGRAHVRSAGIWILTIGAVAVVASYVIYYSHFKETYQQTVSRISAGQGEDRPTKLAAPPLVKLQRWLDESSDDYGLPGLPLFVAALAGTVALARRRSGETLSLVLAAWALAWIGFAALGVLSPIQTRINMAAAPMFLCLGAYGLSAAAQIPRVGPVLALVMGTAICWSGAAVWMRCLGQH